MPCPSARFPLSLAHPPRGRPTVSHGAHVRLPRVGVEEGRAELREAVGDAALVDAAGIVSIFDAVVRIADSTGTPLEDYKVEISKDLRQDLGIDDFPSARTTLDP